MNLTWHEVVTLRLADYGFVMPGTAGAVPGLIGLGLLEDRGGRWHVTGRGRLAARTGPAPAGAHCGINYVLPTFYKIQSDTKG